MRFNHHTQKNPAIPDAGYDPLASPESPFRGDFVLSGQLSAYSPDQYYSIHTDNMKVDNEIYTQTLFAHDITAYHMDVDYINIKFTETSGFAIHGDDYSIHVPPTTPMGNVLLLSGIGLSTTSWAAIGGDLSVGGAINALSGKFDYLTATHIDNDQFHGNDIYLTGNATVSGCIITDCLSALSCPDESINCYQRVLSSNLIEMEPVQGFSSMTYFPKNNSLICIACSPSQGAVKFLEYSRDLEFIREMSGIGFFDAEAICWVSGNTFAIMQERNQAGIVLESTAPISFTEIYPDTTSINFADCRTITVSVDYWGNKGPEGITYDGANNRFIFTREGCQFGPSCGCFDVGSPNSIGVFTVPVTGGQAVELFPTVAKLSGLFSNPSVSGADLSECYLHPPTQVLWILSDRDKSLSAFDLAGNCLAGRGFPWFTQPEAMAITPDFKNLYIGGEPEEIERYDLIGNTITLHGSLDITRHLDVRGSAHIYGNEQIDGCLMVSGTITSKEGTYGPLGNFDEIDTKIVKITSQTNPYTDAFILTATPDGGARLRAYNYVEGVQYGNNAISAAAHAEGDNTLAFGYASHTEGHSTVATGSYAHSEGYAASASGLASHAEGTLTIAPTYYSHAEGFKSIASGLASHAEGYETLTIGQGSHSEGYNTSAIGLYSHAEGELNLATGQGSHAEGTLTYAKSIYSHTEGYNTSATDWYAHAEGAGTKASGVESHAEGESSVASGDLSHAEGNSTTASGIASHAEGESTVASQGAAHAEGSNTTASGAESHAEGDNTRATQHAAHAEGWNTYADQIAAHAEGELTTAIGRDSHTEGYYTSAIGLYSHAEGCSSLAIGDYTHVEGCSALAQGDYSHAEGYHTVALGLVSHAEGASNIASGLYSHAEGALTQAIGNYSHTEGAQTVASGVYAHAEGFSSQALGDNSHAEGGSVAVGDYSHSEGSSIAFGDYSHSGGIQAVAAHDNSWIWSAYATFGDRLSTTQTKEFLVSADLVRLGNNVVVDNLTATTIYMDNASGIHLLISAIDAYPQGQPIQFSDDINLFAHNITGNNAYFQMISTYGGTSNNWNSTYIQINTLSAGWSSVQTTVNNNSARWESDWTLTNTNSANWNSTYSTVLANSGVWGGGIDNFVSLTGDVMTGGLSTPSLSADFVYTPNGTSTDWNSTHTTVNSNSSRWESDWTLTNTNSANWQSAYITINALSADIGSDFTIVQANSANWNSAYSQVNILSSGWASTQTTVNTNSTRWESNWILTNVNSAGWMGGNSAFTTVNANSAGWNSAYTTIHDLSSEIGSDFTIVQTSSASWNSVYTQVNNLSSGWASTQTTVNTNSSRWESNWTTTNTNSANWNSTYSQVDTLSSGWSSVQTTVNTNSAIWNSANTTVNANSGRWESNWTLTNANSASWASAYTQLNTLSSGWASTQTTTNTNSANWNSVYSQVNNLSSTWSTGFVHITGDVMTGNLSTPVLSATNIIFNGSTLSTQVTSTGVFLTLTVNGSALAIPLYLFS